MVNYVNTVLVSNLNSSAIAKYADATQDTGSMSTPSAHAGKFVFMNCDANVKGDEVFNVTEENAATIQTIKVGVVTSKNNRLVNPATGATEYRPIIKWSNEIKAADIKSYSILNVADWAGKPVEDTVEINFNAIDGNVISKFREGGKRIIVRLTYKDMPHRYRKWTESYEYVTSTSDNPTTIPANIANMINKEWKRARIQATTNNGILKLVALPYDDDDSVDSLSWANKVRFNVNIYWTDPAGEGWESTNKHFPKGVTINKTPGEQYPASAKLVRDRESWAMGYQGILNRGDGTWPIIKPDMETKLDADYDAITLEFENMYRAADDIQRKTKQTLEIYCHDTAAVKKVLDAFVTGIQQGENIVTYKPNTEA